MRTAVLTPLILLVWWSLLVAPSLWLFRWVAYAPLAIFLAPPGYAPIEVNAGTGEWVFNVAVNADGVNLKTGQPQHIDSVEFAVAPDNVAFFVSGWFTYLALAFSAAHGGRPNAKRLFRGIAFQTAISILCLSAYVYINGYGFIVKTTSNRPFSIWLLEDVYHIIYLVVPFAGPFLIAVIVHPEWRDCFGRALMKATPLPRRRR